MMDKAETVIIVVMVVLILLLVILFIAHGYAGIADYNCGVCKLCGGHYVYDATIGHAYTTEYIYICNDCGNMLHVGTYMGK